jgi:transcriptional regulator
MFINGLFPTIQYLHLSLLLFCKSDRNKRKEKKSTQSPNMYLRAAHAETSIATLRRFIQENPLGILTTTIPSPAHHLIQSSHIPWVLDVKDPSSEDELPILRGHIARQNPQAKAIIEHATENPNPHPQPTSTSHKLQQEVMVLFNGPSHHYVTPKFYTKTKPESGKVVPTWNYAAAQCYGVATVYFDSQAEETSTFLNKQIGDLSEMAETQVMGYEKPWKVSDAPERYVDLLRKNIIGIEIEVTSLGGKFKMSQEMGAEDQQGVVEGMEALKTADGDYVAKHVMERGKMGEAAKAADASKVDL